MTQTDVLVVGAGPTGLTLACDLARRGVAVRIIDRAPEFAAGSRGKGLSPRSLEVLDDLGMIGPILASGVTHMLFRKYRGAEVIAETDPEAGHVPTPDIPYPVGLMIPQWRVEQILRERLAGFGVTVELGAGLRGFACGAHLRPAFPDRCDQRAHHSHHRYAGRHRCRRSRDRKSVV